MTIVGIVNVGVARAHVINAQYGETAPSVLAIRSLIATVVNIVRQGSDTTPIMDGLRLYQEAMGVLIVAATLGRSLAMHRQLIIVICMLCAGILPAQASDLTPTRQWIAQARYTLPPNIESQFYRRYKRRHVKIIAVKKMQRQSKLVYRVIAIDQRNGQVFKVFFDAKR